MSNLDIKQQLGLKPTDEELKVYAELAKKSFEKKLFLIQKDIEDNPDFHPLPKCQ